MDNDFARIITFLRKENGFSQKKVAIDLNISQALLSHYEKGIRECGLDFLLKISDYYGVSCDYLLGRTSERNSGDIINISSKSNNTQDCNKKDNESENALANQLNETIILNTISLIFDIISKNGNDNLNNSVTNYIMIIIYKLFRMLYKSSDKNIPYPFSIDKNLYKTLSSALEYVEVSLIDFNIRNILENDEDKFIMVGDKINNDYTDKVASLYKLVQKTEEEIERLHKLYY